MRKLMGKFLLLGAFVFSPGILAAQELASICNPRAKYVNVRPGPSAKNYPKVLARLDNGQRIRILDRTMNQEAGREWYKIQYGNLNIGRPQIGFVDSVAVASTCALTSAGPLTVHAKPQPGSRLPIKPDLSLIAEMPHSVVLFPPQPVFDKNSERFFSAMGRGKLHQFDATNGRWQRLMTGAGAFAVSADSSRIVYAVLRSLIVRKIENGDLVKAIEFGERRSIRHVRFSPDGNSVTAATVSGDLVTGNMSSGSVNQQKVNVSGKGVLALSSDGTKALVMTSDRGLSVAFVAGGSTSALFAKADLRSKSFELGAFSPDGKFVAAVDQEEAIYFIEVANGNVRSIMQEKTNPVTSLAIAFDNNRLISGTAIGNLWVWDTKAGSNIAIKSAHSEQIRAVAISPDGKRIVSMSTGRKERLLKLWALTSSPKERQEIETVYRENIKERLALIESRKSALARRDCGIVTLLDNKLIVDPQESLCRLAIKTDQRDEALKRRDCDEVKKLDAEIKSDPREQTCRFEKVLAEGDARALFQFGVDFDIARNREKAKAVYMALRQRFPNDDLAIDAAKRLVSIADAEASEVNTRKANEAAVLAASEAARQAENARRAEATRVQEPQAKFTRGQKVCNRGYPNNSYWCASVIDIYRDGTMRIRILDDYRINGFLAIQFNAESCTGHQKIDRSSVGSERVVQQSCF